MIAYTKSGHLPIELVKAPPFPVLKRKTPIPTFHFEPKPRPEDLGLVPLPFTATKPMAKDAIMPMAFNGEKNIVLRTFIDDKGVVWFVAHDILKALKYPEDVWKDEKQVHKLFFNVLPLKYIVKNEIAYNVLNTTCKTSSKYICVMERGVRSFLYRFYQPAVQHIVNLVDSEIIPYYHQKVIKEVFDRCQVSVRMFKEADGMLWFVAKDLVQALGYTNESTNEKSLNTILQDVPSTCKDKKIVPATSSHVDNTSREETGTTNNSSILSTPVICLNEEGVYVFFEKIDEKDTTLYRTWITESAITSSKQNMLYKAPLRPEDGAKRKFEDIVITDTMTATDIWEEVIYIPTRGKPDLEAKKQAIALRAAREQTGGIDRPMYLAVGRTMKLDKLAIMINSYWLDRNIDVKQLTTWLRSAGYLESNCRSNFPSQLSKSKNLFQVRRFVYSDDKTGEAHLKVELEVTDVGVEYFTTLCVKGEQFLVA